MLILTKYVDSIEEVKKVLEGSCKEVGIIMKEAHDNFNINSYNDYVEWALKSCLEELPTPFSLKYPNCWGLNLGSNYFTVRIPNHFGIGIKVNKRKKISFDVDVIFYNDEDFIKETPDVKYMIENQGWTIKTINGPKFK